MLGVAGAAVVAMVMALSAAPAMALPVGTHAGEPAMSHSAEPVGAQPGEPAMSPVGTHAGEPAMTDLAMPAITDPVVEQPVIPDPVVDQQPIQPFDQQPIFNNADRTDFTGFNHVVQPGDTLSGIAENLGTTHDVLVSENGLSNPNLIFPGQVIGHLSS